MSSQELTNKHYRVDRWLNMSTTHERCLLHFAQSNLSNDPLKCDNGCHWNGSIILKDPMDAKVKGNIRRNEYRYTLMFHAKRICALASLGHPTRGQQRVLLLRWP